MSKRLYTTCYFLTINPNVQFKDRSQEGFKEHIKGLQKLTDEIFDSDDYGELLNGETGSIRNLEIFKSLEYSSIKRHPHVHILLVIHKRGPGKVTVNYDYIRSKGREFNLKNGRHTEKDGQKVGKSIHLLNKIIPEKDIPKILEYIQKGNSAEVFKYNK